MAPVPIILIGSRGAIGEKIAAMLKPEFETIQFINSVSRAKLEIPMLQSGLSPPPDSDNVGSHNFSQRPEAVLFGRVFDEKQVQEIREHCGGSDSGLAWVLSTKEARENAMKNVSGVRDEVAFKAYADRTTQITKDVLTKMRDEGKMGKDGLYEYGD